MIAKKQYTMEIKIVDGTSCHTINRYVDADQYARDIAERGYINYDNEHDSFEFIPSHRIEKIICTVVKEEEQV